MTIKEFQERMSYQEELEVLAWDTYIKSAAKLKPGKYNTLFLDIAKEEEHHAKLIKEVLELLE